MKVMSILPPQLQGKAKAETFLSIFLETLVWSATDEGVDDLVKNMVKEGEKKWTFLAPFLMCPVMTVNFHASEMIILLVFT